MAGNPTAESAHTTEPIMVNGNELVKVIVEG
jgi:hypothetical protein